MSQINKVAGSFKTGVPSPNASYGPGIQTQMSRRKSIIEDRMDEMLLAGDKRISDIEQEALDIGFDPKTKKNILYSCLAALCIGNMMLDNVYAFLPSYIKERNETNDWSNPGDEITPTESSFILAIFSIA